MPPGRPRQPRVRPAAGLEVVVDGVRQVRYASDDQLRSSGILETPDRPAIWHEFRATDYTTLEPASIVRNLTGQLATAVPAYSAALVELERERGAAVPRRYISWLAGRREMPRFAGSSQPAPELVTEPFGSNPVGAPNVALDPQGATLAYAPTDDHRCVTLHPGSSALTILPGELYGEGFTLAFDPSGRYILGGSASTIVWTPPLDWK